MTRNGSKEEMSWRFRLAQSRTVVSTTRLACSRIATEESRAFSHILCVVVDRAQGRSLTDEERAAVQAALQYFRTGGQRHTADEEQSLFPRLRKSDAQAFEEIDRLEHDHREANDLHTSVERLYTTWIESSGLAPDETQQLLSETSRLKQLYSDHIRSRKRQSSLAPRRCWITMRSPRLALSSDSGGNNLRSADSFENQVALNLFRVTKVAVAIYRFP